MKGLGGAIISFFTKAISEIRGSIFKVKVVNPVKIPAFPKRIEADVEFPEKQEIGGSVKVTNSTPGEAIPVRLTSSDGRRFYEILTQFFGATNNLDNVKKLLQEIADNTDDL